MARRCVMLGPVRGDVVLAAEVTPMDAAAFCGGKWRVSFTNFAGPLSDATVVMRMKEWVAEPDEQSTRQRAEDVAWETVLMMSRGKQFTIPVPMDLAA